MVTSPQRTLKLHETSRTLMTSMFLIFGCHGNATVGHSCIYTARIIIIILKL